MITRRREGRLPNRTRSRGFTLIEMLIVIAIIAILATILFPVFARARENARRTSCQSNLKQISLGILQYTQDNDERYPMAFYVTSPWYYGWTEAIQPYVKNTQVYQCPSETSTPSADPHTEGYTDYWYNQSFGFQWTGDWIETGVHESKFAAPTLTVMLGDGYGNYSYYVSDKTETTASPVGSAIPNVRHLEGANYAFADGHVKWLRPEKIANGYCGDGLPFGTPGVARPTTDLAGHAATFSYF